MFKYPVVALWLTKRAPNVAITARITFAQTVEYPPKATFSKSTIQKNIEVVPIMAKTSKPSILPWFMLSLVFALFFLPSVYAATLSDSVDNVLIHYSFNTGTYNTTHVFDIAGLNNNGSKVGALTQSSGGMIGSAGNSLVANGNSLRVGYKSFMLKPWCISYWFNITTENDAGRFIDKGATYDNYWVSATNQITFRHYGDAVERNSYTPAGWSTGKYYHVTWCLNTTVNNIYIDGILNRTVAGNSLPTQTTNLYFFDRSAADRGLKGLMDEITYFGFDGDPGLLSDEAVYQLYLNESLGCGYNDSWYCPAITPNPAPKLTLENVINKYGNFTLNGSTVLYSSGNFTFYASLSDEPFLNLSSIDYGIYNSSHSLLFNGSSFKPANNSLFRFNISALTFRDFDHSPFNLSVWANDSGNSMSFNSSIFNVTDSIKPVCIGFVNDTVNNNSFAPLSAICTDDSLFYLNVTCNNGYKFFVDGLDTTEYNFSNQTYITAPTSCFYEVCDGHTAQLLPSNLYIDKTEDTIKATYQDKEVIFSVLSETPYILDYIKQNDRISFTVEYENKEEKPVMHEYKFRYVTDGLSYYTPSDKHRGWIKNAATKTWFDMELDDPHAKVTVKQITANVFDISVYSYNNRLKFDSIGALNCDSGAFYITVSPPIKLLPGIKEFDTVPVALFYMFLGMLWVAFIVLFLLTRGSHGGYIQMFNIIQFLCSFILGIGLLNYSILLGLSALGGGIFIMYGFSRF